MYHLCKQEQEKHILPSNVEVTNKICIVRVIVNGTTVLTLISFSLNKIAARTVRAHPIDSLDTLG